MSCKTITNGDSNVNGRIFVLYLRVYTLLLHILSTFYIDCIINAHNLSGIQGSIITITTFQIKENQLRRLNDFPLLKLRKSFHFS